MIINHPHLGPRDASEFTILGDASLINRPDWQSGDADDAFYNYQYLRDNPAGLHRELWFHEQGDRSWLVVTRDTVTHAVVDVVPASDVVLSPRTSQSQASKTAKAFKSAKAANTKRSGTKARAKKPIKLSISKGQQR